MKKYYDYIDEISQDDIFDGFLGYGLFTDKLPPLFTSKAFCDYCKTPRICFSSKETNYIRFESIRNTNVPRLMGIPTPFAYYNLICSIRNNWDILKKHFFNNTFDDLYKISRIHIRKMHHTNALFEMNYDLLPNDISPIDDFLIGARFVVHADISTCFPSMYSHSIGWALAGKSVAKANKSNKSLFYNQLDFYIRNCKNGETNGFIIGPHAYNLLSEIILVNIDSKLKCKYKFVRNIDDYECYVRTQEEANQFLVDLNNALFEYNLLLNHKKTKIVKLPEVTLDNWVRQLNYFNLVDYKSGLTTYKEVNSYFDLINDLMQQNDNNSAIVKYGIRVLSNCKMSKSAIELYVKKCCHFAIVYPYLISILDEYVFKLFSTSKEIIENFVQEAFNDSILNNNYEASYYCLYYAMIYDFNIKNLDLEFVVNSNSCILKVVAYLYYKDKLMSKELDALKDNALDLKINDMDEYWLFIYEILDSKDLDGDWKMIKNKHITFIK